MYYETQKYGSLEIKVSLKKFISNGAIFKEPLHKDEIVKLLRIVDRDLKEATNCCHEIDWQFAIAYNAALQLATIVLRSAGYRASTKVGHHWATFTVLPEILGDDSSDIANYFNDCRTKKHHRIYRFWSNLSTRSPKAHSGSSSIQNKSSFLVRRFQSPLKHLPN